eukprot:855086-Alexandrium_andersonii.AAC.1
MSVVGEAVAPEDVAEDIDEETHVLRSYMAPEKLRKEQEEEAADLTRALFAAGASPGEARATLVEAISPPG